MDQSNPERIAELLAASQSGVISRSQALGAGLSRHVVQSRLSSGTWLRLLPGIYRLRGAAESWMQRIVAAYLWSEPDGVISHASAARLLRIEGTRSEQVSLWIPKYRDPSSDWIVTHETCIPASDTALSGRVRITRPIRTVIDLASDLKEEQLEIAVEDCLRRGLFTVEDLLDRMQTLQGRRGLRKLRGVIHRVCGGPPTDSLFEVKLRRLIRKAKLPQPVGQFPVGAGSRRFRLDFAYPERLLAIEADGYASHSGREAFEGDRKRLSVLAGLGWRVVHITWRQLTREPGEVIQRIAKAHRA